MTTSKKRILKWVLISLLVVITTGGIIAYQLYNKPHRNVTASRSIPVSALQLASEYESNEEQANLKYLDKVLEVDGVINEISKNQSGESVITLKGNDMTGVICTLQDNAGLNAKPGTSITLKGICTGYLTDVILVRAIVLEK